MYTVWHEIFAGLYFHEFHGFSDDSRKLNPAKREGEGRRREGGREGEGRKGE